VPGFQWSGELTLGDVFTLVGLIFAGVTVWFLGRQIKANAHQTREAAAAQRGRFVVDVVNRYFDDPGMRSLYRKLDTEQFKFNRAEYKGSDDAEAISRMLYTFDTIEHLVELGVLSLKDVAIMGFRIVRAINDPEIQHVLDWLDEDLGSGSRGLPSHLPARRLADQLKEHNLEYRAERGTRV
jgi:hypothetical protein